MASPNHGKVLIVDDTVDIATMLQFYFNARGYQTRMVHRGADALAAVPVMIQRILELPDETLDRYKLSKLRVTALSGSALPGELATEWMDRFGDNIYNLYGSTEVAYASIAGPEDLRAAPGTAGRPPRGTIVRLYDEKDNEVPEGETGRIFVGNDMAFEGYTGGGGKEEVDGLLSSGDVGHFDEDELKSYVKAHLARYKVPREIEFMDELPRNATGKVVKRELVD